MSFKGSFIVNEGNNNLKSRFHRLLQDSQQFDCLVGYFYLSGFHAIYKKLEHVDRIRILIGIETNPGTFKYIKASREKPEPDDIYISDRKVKQVIENENAEEINEIEESAIIEEGIGKFIEWLRSSKLEIKAHRSKDIHAKIYIATFKEGDRDAGRVITGSSNLTHSGLEKNIEFNAELTHIDDYLYAKNKFDEYWKEAVDVNESFVNAVNKSYLQVITPYRLYLKFLYEYFKDELGSDSDIYEYMLPEGFMKLEYQQQAVADAKRILARYGGVFISDVVGLGKTYIATMLAGQLPGRTLVIAPPALVDERNQGSWQRAFYDFGVRSAIFCSVGKLGDIISSYREYTNVIIDEAHRFRNENTDSHRLLAEICRGKRVILVTATPYNNTPMDLLNQIKLFQSPHKSTIPNLPRLEEFFRNLSKKLDNLDRAEDYDEYISIVKKNAAEIREKVLKFLMVRRTRTEIVKYFGDDMKKQKLSFPKVAAPQPLYYKLNSKENDIFVKTVELITQKLTYARYTPLLYSPSTPENERVGQRNLSGFMKTLLVKRLESSFHAFKLTLSRFISSLEGFIREYKNGYVYISKKYISKIFDMLAEGDEAGVQKLLDNDKAEKRDVKSFTPELYEHLTSDMAILREIDKMWGNIHRDPKLEEFSKQLDDDMVLNENKLIVFTESKETASYLAGKLRKTYPTLVYDGSSSRSVREEVLSNFDAKTTSSKDDYKILITTDALSEGVNLHKACVVVNYDLPWNPTRMMQRVGRINRIDTTFDKIYTYNFFPTEQVNDEIKLKELAEAKINMFITLLGNDATLLTEGEPIGSHELFSKLVKMDDEKEENSELKYFTLIKSIRDNEPALFDEIKKLPRKSRSCKKGNNDQLITYFRKGKIQKFFICDNAHETKNYDERELSFSDAAVFFESDFDEKPLPMPSDYYDLQDENWSAFIDATTEEDDLNSLTGKNEKELLKQINFALKNTAQLTDEQEIFIRYVLDALKRGDLPKPIIAKCKTAIENMGAGVSPLKIAIRLQTEVPDKLLGKHIAADQYQTGAAREVVLSMYNTLILNN